MVVIILMAREMKDDERGACRCASLMTNLTNRAVPYLGSSFPSTHQTDSGEATKRASLWNY
jgi:hypothetical protein